MQTQQLKKILQSTYKTNDWLAVLQYISAGKASRLKDTNTHIDKTNTLSNTEKNTFKTLKQIGTFIASEGERMPIFEVTLQSNIRIDRNRVQVNEIIKKQIVKDEIKAALCVFLYDDAKDKEWRFSFISKFSASDFFTEAEEKETNPKRFTYIFGTQEQHLTAIQRFQSLRESIFTIDDFFEAFAIEALSKAFFKEYRDEHYQKFVDYLNNLQSKPTFFKSENDEKEVRDFVKKTLGRIVFLYFVQKKGWLGATDLKYENGDLNFMENYFKAAGADKGFYPNYLTKLFFETLNAQRENDDFDMPDGEIVKIPYLNGGLFENENELYNSLTFKPILFQNLFDFLNSYNFTVYENSPDDHVVAVDPEMLGNIFENLLEDNKDKGAFYTPKEIVQYMCQQSIIEYLDTKLNVFEVPFGAELSGLKTKLSADKRKYKKEAQGQLSFMQTEVRDNVQREQIENFVKNKNANPFIKKHANEIDGFLDTVKICDPAIGSGAFPMGLLQEIFNLKVVLHDLVRVNKNELFHQKDYYDDYFATIKANIIQNSIYGVDIEKGAVDIARLRFWLSLVVDEKTPKALPNLDYKIMQGNSLLESFEGFDLSVKMDATSRLNSAFSETELQHLKNLMYQYFNLGKTKNKSSLSISEQKTEIKNEIESDVLYIIEKLIDEKRRKYNYEIDKIQNTLNALDKVNITNLSDAKKRQRERAIKKSSTGLKTYGKLLNNLESQAIKLKKAHLKNERPYFLWSVYFYDVFKNGGFDIIIGNPPYVQLQRDGGYLANLYKNENFKTFARSGDIYGLFYEKGFDLLKQNGVHTFITSNKWMRANYGKPLRKYLANQNAIRLLDLGPGVFPNATVDTNILIAKKAKNQRQLQSITIGKRQELDSLQDSEFVKMPNVDEDIWTVLSATELKIKNQIEKIGTPLKDWDIEINYGIKTGYNDAFIIDTEKRNELVAADPKSAEIIKPILKGRNIQRYRAEWANLWMVTTFPAKNIDIDKYPVVKSYLETFLPKIKQTGEIFINKNGKKEKTRKKTSNKWFETQDQISFYEDFQKEKIIYSEIVREAQFYYDTKIYYPEATTFLLTGESVKYLCALLNSHAVTYAFKTFYAGGGLGENGYRYKKVFLINTPIPKVQKRQQQVFETLVDYILHLHATEEAIDEYVPNNHIITELEKVINGCVYELYFKESIEKAKAAVLDLAMELFKPLPTDATAKTKNEIIAEVFLELQASKNPIRNRLILQNILVKEVQFINTNV